MAVIGPLGCPSPSGDLIFKPNIVVQPTPVTVLPTPVKVTIPTEPDDDDEDEVENIIGHLKGDQPLGSVEGAVNIAVYLRLYNVQPTRYRGPGDAYNAALKSLLRKHIICLLYTSPSPRDS